MASNLDTSVTGGQPRARSVTLIAWCAAASLGLLFVKANSLLDFAQPRSGLSVRADATAYVPLAVPALALVVWHLYPRRSWPWLLLAGAACATPLVILRLVPDLYGRWMAEALAILTVSASGLTLVGVLAAATVVWQSGRRDTGAALIGTALVIQLVGPLVMASTSVPPGFFLGPTEFFQVLSAVLVVIAIAGAVVALRVEQPEPAGRPGWRVTIAGGLVAACPVVTLLWRPEVAVGSPRSRTESIADYLLYIGLALLAIGLVAGVAAGTRALLSSAATGLLLGTFGMLLAPSVEVLGDLAVLTVIAALGSMILAYGVALSRWRTRIGTGGLAVVAVGLIVLYLLFDRDDPPESDDVITRVITPVLLVAGIVAAVAAISSVGSELAAHAETPAVLAGLTNAFSLGAICIIAYLATTTAPDDRAPIVGLLPPAIGGILIAMLLTWRRSPR